MKKKNGEVYLIIESWKFPRQLFPRQFPQQLFPRNKVNEQAIIPLTSFMYCVLHCITFQSLKYPKAQAKL